MILVVHGEFLPRADQCAGKPCRAPTQSLQVFPLPRVLVNAT